jgi:hypothetical protein
MVRPRTARLATLALRRASDGGRREKVRKCNRITRGLKPMKTLAFQARAYTV